MKEFYISFRQATSLLLKCEHDFRLMVGELLCVRDGKIALRNLTLDTFNPVKAPRKDLPKTKLAYFNHNSSRMLSNENFE